MHFQNLNVSDVYLILIYILAAVISLVLLLASGPLRWSFLGRALWVGLVAFQAIPCYWLRRYLVRRLGSWLGVRHPWLVLPLVLPAFFELHSVSVVPCLSRLEVVKCQKPEPQMEASFLLFCCLKDKDCQISQKAPISLVPALLLLSSFLHQPIASQPAAVISFSLLFIHL